MRSLFSWLRTHRLPRIFLGLVIAVLGLHFFANWRGEKRWENYVAEARARGVKMSVDEIIPPAIPAAENFAALPMLSAIFNGGNKYPMLIDNPRSLVPDPLKGERIDWIAWQAFFLKVGWITDTTDSAPGDVLRGLEHFAPEIAQWHEWPQRPRARYPLDWKEIVMPLPHISTMIDAEKIFALRLRAHLALGDSAAACGQEPQGRRRPSRSQAARKPTTRRVLFAPARSADAPK